MVQVLPDITGAGVAVALGTLTGGVWWVQVNAAAGNASPIRVGDAATSSSRGIVVQPGASQFFPAIADVYSPFYTLTGIFVYIAVGDKVTVSYGG